MQLWQTLLLTLVAFGLGWLIATLGQDSSAPSEPALGFEAMYDATLDALEHPDFTERTVLIIDLTRQLNAENREAMMQALEANLGSTASDDLRLVVREMAREDPQATFERVMQWPRTERLWASQVTSFEWAKRNPASALDTIDKVMAREKGMEGIQRGFVYGWAWSRKPGLSEYLRTLKQNRHLSEFTVVQAAEIRRHEGSPAVIEWAEAQIEIGDPDWSALVFEQTLSAIGFQTPELAMAFYEGHQDQPYATQGPKALAMAAGRRDPEAILAWLRTLPADEKQYEGMKAAWGDWAMSSPAEATAWLREADRGPDLDGALAAYIDKYKAREPLQGYMVASQISNPGLRQAAQVKTLSLFLRTRKEEAKAWLTQNEVPEQVLAEIREGTNRPRKNPMQEMLAPQNARD